MTYTVKEIFYTLQGEGAQLGRPAVFCRFSGCNLACIWCDTDFAGGDKFVDATALADAILAKWPSDRRGRFVVLTGGEPALQVDPALVVELKRRSFFVAIETNGTIPLDGLWIQWICVSPKAGSSVVVTDGDELKLVYPQPGAEPEMYADLAFRTFSLSPLDNDIEHARAAAAYCLAHPQWRLGTRLHQTVGFP